MSTALGGGTFCSSIEIGKAFAAIKHDFMAIRYILVLSVPLYVVGVATKSIDPVTGALDASTHA